MRRLVRAVLSGSTLLATSDLEFWQKSQSATVAVSELKEGRAHFSNIGVKDLSENISRHVPN